MRARMGILLAKQPVLLRAIQLKNKPTEMLTASPKGTVPVLILDETTIIDESLDIMLWALEKTDPDNLLCREQPEVLPTMLALINHFDTEFKTCLNKYKSAKRYHDDNQMVYREQCESFIIDLESRLSKHKFLMGDALSLVDFALFPYIRQFAKVDRQWYLQAPYPKLQNWLKTHLDSKLFSKTMTIFPLWLDSHEDCLLYEGNPHK